MPEEQKKSPVKNDLQDKPVRTSPKPGPREDMPTPKKLLKYLSILLAFILVASIASILPQVYTTPLPSLDAAIANSQKPEKPKTDAEFQGTVLFNLVQKQNPATMLYYDPLVYDQEEWTREQIVDYLGKDICPTFIPGDLKEESESEQPTESDSEPKEPTWTVYYRKNGELVYDYFSATYSAAYDEAEERPTDLRSVTFGVSKLGLKSECTYRLEENETEKISKINGVEMVLGYKKTGYGYNSELKPAGYTELYTAYFERNGTSYEVIANNLTQKEFLNIISAMSK